jgi:hypothetical protein
MRVRNVSRRAALAGLVGAAAGGIPVLRCPAAAPPVSAVGATYQFLYEQMDQFHLAFDVYDDGDSGATHFFPSLFDGDLAGMKAAQIREVFDGFYPRREVVRHRKQNGDKPITLEHRPHRGTTCIRIVYPRKLARDEDNKGWVSVRWVYPDGNYGQARGHDLSPYSFKGEKAELVFWARGEKGGEYAEFLVGGTNRTPYDDEKVPFADSLDRHTTKVVRLKREWKEYRIALTDGDLSNLINGFTWVASRLYNPNGCVTYVDSVQVRFGPRGQQKRLSEPRFIRSYVPERPDEPDGHFRNVCYVYDNALALLAFLARGRPEDRVRARTLADAFLYAQGHDRRHKDGRLRNAYMAGALWSGRRGGAARLPGRWDDEAGKWLEEEYVISSDAGNLAWVMLALLGFWRHLPAKEKSESPYLLAAVRLGRWIHRHCHATDKTGGYTGGLEGWAGGSDGQKKIGWKSTEHNIDLYAAFLGLHQARKSFSPSRGDPDWQRCALRAEAFVERMWNDKEGHFWTGTEPDGVKINRKPVPLDPAPWSLLSFRSDRYARALAWAEKHCHVARCPADPAARGFAFSNARGGVWWEGTAQMALAYRLLERTEAAERTLKCLRAGVSCQGGIFASSRDGLPTGFEKSWGEWVYYKRRHVGASAWFLFASLGWNPYWSEPARLAR